MNQFEQWLFDIPPITRAYCFGIALVTASTQLQILAPYHLFFSWKLIYKYGQWWRLFTRIYIYTDLVLHFMKRMRYSKMTEEGFFRSRPWDYLWMLFLGATSMIVTVAIFDTKKAIPFLSSSLNSMLVYVWSRRNPHVRMNFLGVLNFQAPYLPWVLMAFTVLLNGIWPWGDILGLAIGHLYYFLEDVYPRMPNSGGRRLLESPRILKQLFQRFQRDRGNAEIVEPIVEAEAENEEQERLIPNDGIGNDNGLRQRRI